MKNKIAINECYGGFQLSVEAILLYAKKKNWVVYCYNHDIINHRYQKVTSNIENNFAIIFVTTKDFGDLVNDEDFNYENNYVEISNIARHDKALIETIEELGERASTKLSKIVVKEIEGNQYVINEYDGYESIATPKSIDWINIENEG